MKKNVNDEQGQGDTGVQSLEFTRKTSRGKVAAASGEKNSEASPGRSKAAMPQLMQVFAYELKDMYWAEKSLKVAILKMVQHAVSDGLVGALETHWKETSKHVTRLEAIFELIGKKPRTRKCEGMKGLIKEADRLMKACKPGPMCDAAIVCVVQKIAHYEIATYGTLRQFAETLGMPEAAHILAAILEEEKAANDKFTEVAVAAGGVNQLSMQN